MSAPAAAVVLQRTLEDRILDAARVCCERWGINKVTVDDIATEAKISRATLYRLFPGGRDVLFEKLRERDIRDFLIALDARLAGVTTYEALVVAIVGHATRQLREDTHLQLMLASSPGEVARELGVDGMPNIVRLAAALIGPRVEPFIGAAHALELSEWLARIVLSYFLAPSDLVDLADPAQTTQFVRRFVLPAFPQIA